MAKTTGALFSIEASGQFAKTIVFDKRGLARVYKIPANPKTTAQGDQRQRMANIQRAIGAVGTLSAVNVGFAFLTGYKSKIPQSYRWQSQLLGDATKAADYAASVTAWAALDSTAKGNWNTAATTAGITAVAIDYAAETAPTNGQSLFHLSRAIWFSGSLDLDTAPATTIPGASNSAQWAECVTG